MLFSATGGAARAQRGGRDKPQPFSEGLLWRVSRRGANDSYVFGTIHLADARVGTVPKAAQDALGRSRLLAMELAADVVVDPRVFELETFRDGRRLDALVSPGAYEAVRVALVAQGGPEEEAVRLKPWAAMLRVARSPGSAEVVPIDRQLLAAARARRIRVVPLEWVEEQIAAFDAIPLESQVALLEHAVEHRAALEAEVGPTIAAWQRGQLGELASFGERMAERYPGRSLDWHYHQLTRHIIHNRTVLMHHRLLLPLRQGRAFVAVGAQHLYGDKGLLRLIERDGYQVTRID